MHCDSIGVLIVVDWQVVDRSSSSAAVPLDRCGLAVEARFSFFGGYFHVYSLR